MSCHKQAKRRLSDESRAAMRAAHRRRQMRLAQACEMVPIEPFQRRFLELRSQGETTAARLAEHLGWHKKTPPSSRSPHPTVPDGTRVTRALGLTTSRDKRMRAPASPKEFLSYDLALRFAELLGLDPCEVGL